MKRAVRKCFSIKAVIRLWSHGATHAEALAGILRDAPSHGEEVSRYTDAVFMFDVVSFGAKLIEAHKRAILAEWSPIRDVLKGKISLDKPKLTMLLLEDYGPQIETRDPSKPLVPKGIYFGRVR